MRVLRVLSRSFLPSLLIGSISLRAPVVRAEEHRDAGQHFEEGVRAFEQQRFADAAREFEDAYRIQPTWQVLYNLGSVYSALGRPVEAVRAFERYLRDGGEQLDPERRRAVDAELGRQRAKIAVLHVSVNESDAEVRVDVKTVGQWPHVGPIELAEGAHLVEVALEGCAPQRREVQLQGGQQVSAVFTLVCVPPPMAAPAPSTSSASRQPSPSVGTAQRVVGYSMGGLGLGGLGAGIVVLAQSQSLHLEAVDKANAGDRPKAEDMESDAQQRRAIGLATVGIGGVLVLGGLIVLVTAPTSSARTALGISSWATTSSQGITWKGTW